MGWAKLDDAYPHHPKLLEAGEAGLALDVCGICYVAKHETDGFIPEAALPLLGPVKNPKRAAAALVKVGRWERDEERKGWIVHDYLDYNPAAQDRENERRKARERMANARRNNGRSSGEPRENFSGSSPNPDPAPPTDEETPPTPQQAGGRTQGLRSNGTNPRAVAKAQRLADLEREIEDCETCGGQGWDCTRCARRKRELQEVPA